MRCDGGGVGGGVGFGGVWQLWQRFGVLGEFRVEGWGLRVEVLELEVQSCGLRGSSWRCAGGGVGFGGV